MNMKTLALSGGGAQGLFTAGVLARLEPVGYDYVAGTSIGAALGACVAFGLDMKEVEETFAQSAAEVFPGLGTSSPEVEKFYATARGAVKARYRQKPWRKLLLSFFGDKTMGQSPVGLMIPAIEFRNGTVRVFSSWESPDIPVVDVVLASSAAPTFFPKHRIEGEWYVDGGQAANAPDMVLLSYLLSKGYPLEEIEMLSIGTASSRPGLESSGNGDWGLAYWGAKDRMLRLSMAVSQNVHVMMAQQLLGARYTRLDAMPLPHEARHLSLDGATPKAVDVLRSAALSVDIGVLGA